MVVKGLKIVGSSVGTEEELQELLKLGESGKVVAQTEVMPFGRFQEAIDKVARSNVMGRIVLKIDGEGALGRP
jgi:propanol-preferring alcohol dehydrogenase